MIEVCPQEMRVSIPRLRRVRFHDGRSLEVIDTRANRVYGEVRNALRDAYFGARDMEAIAGFGIVAWSADGNTAYRNVYNSEVSPLQRRRIPGYTKDKLRSFIDQQD